MVPGRFPWEECDPLKVLFGKPPYSVVFVVPSLDDTTGWGRWANDFLRHIEKRGIRPFIYGPRSCDQRIEGINPGIHYMFELPELFDSLQSFRGARSLRDFFRFQMAKRKPPPDLAFVHSLEAYPWCIYGDGLSRKWGVPHLITTHGRYGYIPARRFVDRHIYRRVLRRTCRIIPVSNAVRSAVENAFPSAVQGDRYVTIYNAVDPDRVVKRSSCRLKESSYPRILSVTRFIECKDIETSVRVFSHVKKRFPDASYDIVGPGNNPLNGTYQGVLKVLEELNLSCVRIAGQVTKEQLAEYYSRADVFLHTPKTLPDDFESYSLVLLESGLFDLPVVATKSGGIPEVIRSGINGLLAPEGDVDGLANAVHRILTEPELAASLAKNNRTLAEQRNWEWYMDQQMAIYEAVLMARIELAG